ncbi:MAG: hypothetical protein JJU28_21290 [Cyclobacteriaceae bacterium]|nr:hypothetical protein [Cyclobacteriaceae bacterium]
MKSLRYYRLCLLIGILFLGGMISCNVSVRESSIQNAEFFKLRELIDDQALRLSENNALLYKQAFIDEEFSDQLLMHEACKWAKELEIFKDADLNIPALKNSYSYSMHETDTGVLHKWKSLYPYETKVDEFLVFKNIRKEPSLIKSTMKYGNYLYQTEKFFELNLVYDDDLGLLLKEYKIEGWKKLLRNDTVFYSLVGEIR